MKNRQYQGVQLSKKESELVQWLQKGEHTWVDAFYMYPQRRKPVKVIANRLKEKVWFNSTLNKLHAKGLCTNVPFVYDAFAWRNPGISTNKANFVALTLQEVNVETKELARVI